MKMIKNLVIAASVNLLVINYLAAQVEIKMGTSCTKPGEYVVTENDVLNMKYSMNWNENDKIDEIAFIYGQIYAYKWYEENPSEWKGQTFCYKPQDEGTRKAAIYGFWHIMAQGAAGNRESDDAKTREMWTNWYSDKYFPKTTLLVNTYKDKIETNEELDNVFSMLFFAYGNPESKWAYRKLGTIINTGGIKEGFRKEFLESIKTKNILDLSNKLINDIDKVGYGVVATYYYNLLAKANLWSPIFAYWGNGFIMGSVNPNSTVNTKNDIRKFFYWNYRITPEKYDAIMKVVADDPEGQIGFLRMPGVAGNSSDMAMALIIEAFEELKIGDRNNANFKAAVKKLAGNMNYHDIDYNLKVYWDSQNIRHKTYCEIGLGLAQALKLTNCQEEAIKALDAKDHKVRIAACYYLAECGNKGALTALNRVASSDPYVEGLTFPVRNEAKAAIAKINERGK